MSRTTSTTTKASVNTTKKAVKDTSVDLYATAKSGQPLNIEKANADMRIDGNILTISVDLSKVGAVSENGKTRHIAYARAMNGTRQRAMYFKHDGKTYMLGGVYVGELTADNAVKTTKDKINTNNEEVIAKALGSMTPETIKALTELAKILG